MNAPERIELMPEWVAQYRAAIKSPFAVAYVPEAALTTAHARIAELEAALALRTGADHDEDCKAKRGKLCNCGHDQARRALEAKP